MKNFLDFGPFGGVATQVNPATLALRFATDSLNGRFEDGKFATRYGWRNWQAAPAGFTALKGANFLSGYSAVGVTQQKYLTIETVSGAIKPWERDASSGTRVEVTDDGTPLSLADGEYDAVAFNGEAYVLRRSGEVWRHQLGDATDWRALDAGRPAAAPVPTVSSLYEPPDEPVPGTPFDWTGKTAADVADLVNLTFDSVGSYNSATHGVPVTGTYVYLDGGSLTGASSFAYEVAAVWGSAQDFSDTEYFTIPIKFYPYLNNRAQGVLSNVLRVFLVDASANEQELDVTWDGYVGGSLVRATAKCAVPDGANMSEFDDTVKIRFEWVATLTGTINSPTTLTTSFFMSDITPNNSTAGDVPVKEPSADVYRVKFGVSHWDSERDVEQAEPTSSDWYKIDPAREWFTDSEIWMGDEGLTVEATAPSVLPGTHTRLYVQFEDDKLWRLVETTEESSPSFAVDQPYGVLRAYPVRIDHEPTPVGAPSCAAAYKGFMVWGYETGGQNVKMSAVGNPGRLARTTDTADDLEAGATWSLADAFDDAPQWFGGAGSALVALGKRAAYVSVGEYPTQMTPMREIPKSKGVLGRCATRWTDDNGQPGVVYLGTDFEVWMVQIARGSADDYGEPLAEMTGGVRGKVRDWLLQTSSPTLSQLQIGVDERADALWLVYGSRAMVLRRRNLLEGVRAWEFYSYTGGTWGRWMFADAYGIRAVRSTGAIDEFEVNSATGAVISGTNRDGGSAMPTAYWEHGGIDQGQRTRWFAVRVMRPSSTSCTVKVTSGTAAAVTYTVPAGLSKEKRLGQNQRGYRHKLRVELSETEGPVERVLVETHLAGKQRASE